VLRPEDAAWLNVARPLFAERALRVVLWSKAKTTASLARHAPDFFDWIARRVECPATQPHHAISGLRAALRARAWAVDWQGAALDEAFAQPRAGRRSPEAKRIKELEREVARKDKALAETAALLVLQKKLQLLFPEGQAAEDDDTDDGSDK